MERRHPPLLLHQRIGQQQIHADHRFRVALSPIEDGQPFMRPGVRGMQLDGLPPPLFSFVQLALFPEQVARHQVSQRRLLRVAQTAPHPRNLVQIGGLARVEAGGLLVGAARAVEIAHARICIAQPVRHAGVVRQPFLGRLVAGQRLLPLLLANGLLADLDGQFVPVGFFSHNDSDGPT